MRWKKIGLIFCPDKNYDWMMTHAANPVAEFLINDLFRIYFSCRDLFNRSSIGYVDVDINYPDRIVNLSDVPVLSVGEVGTFDDSGVSMGYIVKHGGRRYLYYLGWNLGVTVPWRNSIGLAIADENTKQFKRYSRAPIMDRNDVDPFSISYPCVVCENGIWKMWYGSNLKWGKDQTDMAHLIKYAESKDGIHWDREGVIALNFENPSEYAMSKPCVINENNLYKMWYSYRGNSYRIGYSESQDGIRWTRKDHKVGIGVSPVGWDAKTIEYPFVFDHKETRYMLYNGNDYGKTGFGLAILE